MILTVALSILSFAELAPLLSSSVRTIDVLIEIAPLPSPDALSSLNLKSGLVGVMAIFGISLRSLMVRVTAFSDWKPNRSVA